MADDEIAVDGYVMKPEVRGTSRDPRALKHEQWMVKVRMLELLSPQREFEFTTDVGRLLARARRGCAH
jgi:hypothetical protein